MNSALSEAPVSSRAAGRLRSRLEQVVGGGGRMRVVVLLGCVLGLESADAASVGAAAPQLKAALHVTNTELGLLVAASTLVGAVVTLPFGALADRVRRVNLLAITVAMWAVAMAVGAAAQDYEWLLLSRLGLGAVTAAAGPVIASLTGDFFDAGERAKMYGYILSGELLGAGFGFVVSGSVAGLLSWRWAFALMALPAIALAAAILRSLPEPTRGARSQLSAATRGEGLARRAVKASGVRADQRVAQLRSPRSQLGLGRAVWYVLRIRTNRWLIAASAVGYFFFAGLRTFALVFVRGHFSLSQPVATVLLFLAGLGSLAGVLLAGRLADRMIRGGRLDARLVVGAVAYLAAAVVLLPAILIKLVAVAIPLLVVAAAMLAAPNPPLDAARLDIVPSWLWGRAESVRTVLRQSAQAAAPLLFGAVADLLGGSKVASSGSVSASSAQALQYAFLIMLVPLSISGAMLLGARRSYPRDVATAIAAEGSGG